MIQSNSKLSAGQKEDRKILKMNMPSVKLVNNQQTTIAYKELGNTVEFALSVMSDNEKKFRAKVGEYNALMRFENGRTVKMARDDFYKMMMIVYGIYL